MDIDDKVDIVGNANNVDIVDIVDSLLTLSTLSIDTVEAISSLGDASASKKMFFLQCWVVHCGILCGASLQCFAGCTTEEEFCPKTAIKPGNRCT